MSSGHGRVRDRVIPSKTVAPFTWGKYFYEENFNQNDWKPLPGGDYVSGTSVPFVSMERCSDTLHHGPPYREGSPFESIKIRHVSGLNSPYANGTYISELRQQIQNVGFVRLKYVGFGLDFPIGWGTSVSSMNLAYPLLAGGAVPSTGTLDSMVWDKTKPKIEQGGLFVALAEIRDVPHMLQKSSHGFHDLWSSIGGGKTGWRMAPKRAADHFLNHNFGWVPFLKDLGDFLDNIRNAKGKIDRLKRDNGNWVRKRAILVNTTDDRLLAKSDGILTFGPAAAEGWRVINAGHYGTPHWENREKSTTFAQSVGSFRYYLPEFDPNLPDFSGNLNSLKRQLDIHGARINPSNVYKAVPWTWLIDWMTPLGKHIQHIQDATMDNMAARYLYLVHHSVKELTLKQFIPFNGLSGGPKTFEFTQIIDVKQRKEASPFGFDPTWDTLTPKQFAILGALGISRKR